MNEMNQFKQLQRTREGRIIAGVCTGIGRYIGVDPNVARIGLAVLSLFGGTGIALYAVGWLLLPEEGASTSIVQNMLEKQRAGR
ncbi:PspC domain-containing protein [Rhizohabitans arisaemae]|uniref:PspC domain-containing protein n=1 Tax=Rhizohabitans arisaemae TaxID=2720610 RepID=UPI0024B20FE4|nr:PspC domain-containing protein [Rhizohabitans arisaemae]